MFAHQLARELRTPTVEPVHGRWYRITGRLDTGVVIVALEVRIPWLFRGLKRFPPVVLCSEPWIKTGADWHNGPPLCWVLHQEWRDAMSWKGKPVRAIVEEGRQWFLNGVRCLINRHYVAHLEGLTEWPAEWYFWGHGADGVREYERTKQSTQSRGVPRRKARNT